VRKQPPTLIFTNKKDLKNCFYHSSFYEYCFINENFWDRFFIFWVFFRKMMKVNANGDEDEGGEERR
jgi:hypothetical protein